MGPMQLQNDLWNKDISLIWTLTAWGLNRISVASYKHFHWSNNICTSLSWLHHSASELSEAFNRTSLVPRLVSWTRMKPMSSLTLRRRKSWGYLLAVARSKSESEGDERGLITMATLISTCQECGPSLNIGGSIVFDDNPDAGTIYLCGKFSCAYLGVDYSYLSSFLHHL